MRIVSRVAGERQLGDDHRDMRVVHQVRILDQHVARQVEHGRFERVAHLFLKLEEGGAVGHQRLVDRRFGRQDRQALVGANHRALDEQAVDAARVLDRVGQAAAGLEVERQRAGAEMDVEVEQRGRAARLLAQQPGERGRDGRGADAAADADDGGHDVRLVGLGFAARARQDRLGMREGVAQLVDRERLQQIIVDAAGDEVAIQAHVVDRAGGDHDRARLAHFGERVDVVQRIGRFAEVDEQDVRAGRDRQRLDRVAQPALVDLLRRPAVLDRNRPQHVGGGIVADEGGERIAQTRACLERSVHYLPPFLVLTVLQAPWCRSAAACGRHRPPWLAVAASPTPVPSRPWSRSSGLATIAARLRVHAAAEVGHRAVVEVGLRPGGSSWGSPEPRRGGG